jgi:hypothetical protein
MTFGVEAAKSTHISTVSEKFAKLIVGILVFSAKNHKITRRGVSTNATH